jgi:hypothetical protein
MKTIKQLVGKPIGEVFQEAGLINSGQLQVALMEKDIYPDLELEEILLLHGWLKQKTVDFFMGMFDKPYFDKTLIIGQLLYQAGLLSKQEIKLITSAQQKMGLGFGSVAALKGFIKQETLDFFLKYFILERQPVTISQTKKTLPQFSSQPTKATSVKPSISSTKNNVKKPQKDDYSFNTLLKEMKVNPQEKSISSYEELVESGLDDIPWID